MQSDIVPVSDSDIESVYAPELNKKNYKFICKIADCNQAFRRQTNLDRHEYHDHDGIKKHICLYENCDKSYITSQHLKRHIQSFHEKRRKEKSIKCRVENCLKYFDSLHSMERHILNVHENAKFYTCKICSVDFDRKKGLRRHEISQHGGEYPYRCEHCEKGYVQLQHFENHKCSHKDPLYKCEICNQEFTKWSIFIEHSKKEHNKAYVCKCCGKEFQRRVDVNNHKRSIKSKRGASNLSYSCSYDGCDRTYRFQKNLTQHIQITHLGKKFKCTNEECTKEYASKQKLREHVKKVHEKSNAIPKPKKPRAKQRPRQDTGKPKQSLASKMSGILTDIKTEKFILDGKADLISMSEIESEISFSEAEMDDKVVANVIKLKPIEIN